MRGVFHVLFHLSSMSVLEEQTSKKTDKHSDTILEGMEHKIKNLTLKKCLANLYQRQNVKLLN